MLLHKLRFIGTSLLGLFCIMLIWVIIKQCPPQKQLFSYEIVDKIHVPIINALFEDADRFKYDLVYPKADSCFRKIWQSKPSHLTNARDSFYCANQLAFINLSMNRNDEAEKWIAIIERMGGESRMAIDAQGDYWYNKGVWAYRMDKPKYADSILQKSLKLLKETYIKSHLKIAYCSNMIGLHHIEYDMSATHSFIKDANDFFESNSHLKKYAKENMLAMAQLCRNDDEYILGEDYCNKGEEIANNLPYFDTIFVSRLLSLRGYMMRKQNQQENKGNDSSINAVHLRSIEYASKANSIFLQESYNFYAYYWLKKDSANQDAIDANFRKCINNIKAITQWPNRERYAFVDLLEGYFLTKYEDNANNNLAISHYENFMRKYANDPICPKWFQEHALYTLSDLYKKTQKFDSALNCVKRDLVFGTDFEDKQNSTWNDLMKPEIQKLKHYQFVDYGLAAGIFLEKGKLDKLPISDRNKNDLNMAFQLYCLADSLLYNSLLSRDEDAILKKIKREGDRLYSGAIELAYLLYKNTPKNNQKYLEKAYLFMERRKAQLLLQHQKWTSKSQYSIKIRKQLETLADIEYRIRQLKGQPLNSNMSIATLQNKKEEILDSLTAQNPSYSILEDTYLPEISTIKRKLKANQMIVNYHVGEDKTHFLVFKHNTEQAAFEVIDIKEDSLTNCINGFMNSIKHDPHNGLNNKYQKVRYIEASNKIYNILISKLEKHLVGINEVIVIPDKSIHRIPFDAILDANSSIPADYDYKRFPYMLWKYKFSYSTSIKSYWKNKNIQILKHIKAAAFVDPQFHEHLSIFKEHYPNENYYTNIKCCKDNFNKNADKYNLIQISLHGASFSEKKDECKIFFNGAKKDSLYGYELNKIHFDSCSLIVIASCKAGSGNDANTEGPFSMYRYFLQAGAGVVIAPLTTIDAEQTADILGLFYAALKTPKMPEDALWESKKYYIERTSYPEFQYHPYFWSGLSCFR